MIFSSSDSLSNTGTLPHVVNTESPESITSLNDWYPKFFIGDGICDKDTMCYASVDPLKFTRGDEKIVCTKLEIMLNKWETSQLIYDGRHSKCNTVALYNCFLECFCDDDYEKTYVVLPSCIQREMPKLYGELFRGLANMFFDFPLFKDITPLIFVAIRMYFVMIEDHCFGYELHDIYEENLHKFYVKHVVITEMMNLQNFGIIGVTINSLSNAMGLNFFEDYERTPTVFFNDTDAFLRGVVDGDKVDQIKKLFCNTHTNIFNIDRRTVMKIALDEECDIKRKREREESQPIGIVC